VVNNQATFHVILVTLRKSVFSLEITLELLNILRYSNFTPHYQINGSLTLQEREAKLLRKSNDLDSVTVYPDTNNNGWCVRFTSRSKNQGFFLESKRNPEPRIFKTSDAALRCCHRIGFEHVEVELDST